MPEKKAKDLIAFERPIGNTAVEKGDANTSSPQTKKEVGPKLCLRHEKEFRPALPHNGTNRPNEIEGEKENLLGFLDQNLRLFLPHRGTGRKNQFVTLKPLCQLPANRLGNLYLPERRRVYPY